MKDKINFQNAELEITAGTAKQFVNSGRPEIAFSGRSNVGKSSLINAILGRKSLARVSSTPGKTITVNYYNVDNSLYLVDLPGYGYAKRSPEERERISKLGDGYFKSPSLKLTVQLVDMKSGPTEDDAIMIDYLERTGKNYIIVGTKADKLNKTERAAMLEILSEAGVPVIPFSALNGEGKDEIKKRILTAAR